MSSECIVNLKDINKSYYIGTETLKVLNQVSLTVKKGEYSRLYGYTR